MTRRQTSTYLDLHHHRYENIKSCKIIMFYTVLRMIIIPSIPGSNPRTVCLSGTFRNSPHSGHGYVRISKEKSLAHKPQRSDTRGSRSLKSLSSSFPNSRLIKLFRHLFWWPSGLRRKSAIAWLLESRVWTPLRAAIFVSCICFMSCI
jgi:hypothetical protein